MIKQEEALLLLIEPNSGSIACNKGILAANNKAKKVIRKIFKSIGTCEECKFFKFHSSVCTIINQPRENSFYCGDFKRKLNEN